MQQYAGIYILQNHSACFGCPSHPSSGVHETVTAASGTGHSNGATTVLQHALIRVLIRPVPEAAVTVSCTLYDGRDGHPKHVKYICSK